MTVHFPGLRPTTRSYEPPEFAQLQPEYVGSIAYPRLLASKPSKAKLSLTYENIEDSDAAKIMAAFMNSLTGFLPIALPVEITSGIEDNTLATQIKTGAHLDWYFDGPPRQSSVIAGISTVQVELSGDIS